MRQYLSLDYCLQNRTKQCSKGYKVICPSCLGKDLWVTESNQRGYCFECTASYVIGEEGSQPKSNKPPRQLFNTDGIRELYAEALQFYRSSINTEHRIYLAKRFGSDLAEISAIIDQFQLGYCPVSSLPFYKKEAARHAGLSLHDGMPSLADRIIFPYLVPYEKHAVTDMRGRCMGNGEPRYKAPFHQSAIRGAIYPFNYNRAMERANEQGKIIITEGEIKAIVADLHGFPIVALPGMTTWRQGFIDLLRNNIQVIVIFDNMYPLEDKIRIDRAIHKLSAYLPSFSVGVLPLLGEYKMDIDAFLLHKDGGEQRFKRVVDESIPYERYRALRRF